MAIDTDNEKWACITWRNPWSALLINSSDGIGALDQQQIMGGHSAITYAAPILTGFFAPFSAFMAIGPAAGGSPPTAKRIFWL